VEKIILLGAGGHARSVIDSIRSGNEYVIVGLTEPGAAAGGSVAGCRILGDDSVLKSLFDGGVRYAFVAVGSTGNTAVRERLFFLLREIGFILPVIVDGSSHIGSEVCFGAGSYVGKNTAVNAQSVIGDMAIVNTGAVVEHGCHVHAFAHIGPGAVLCGGVTVGAGTHIGANATILQGVTIGENSVIGAGSTVLRDVPGHVIAYGSPCRVVRDNV